MLFDLDEFRVVFVLALPAGGRGWQSRGWRPSSLPVLRDLQRPGALSLVQRIKTCRSAAAHALHKRRWACDEPACRQRQRVPRPGRAGTDC